MGRVPVVETHTFLAVTASGYDSPPRDLQLFSSASKNFPSAQHQLVSEVGTNPSPSTSKNFGASEASCGTATCARVSPDAAGV